MASGTARARIDAEQAKRCAVDERTREVTFEGHVLGTLVARREDGALVVDAPFFDEHGGYRITGRM